MVAYDDLTGVLEQLAITSLVMVGLSMGGRNAMYFTAQRPQAVQKLVVVDIGHPPPDPEWPSLVTDQRAAGWLRRLRSRDHKGERGPFWGARSD